MLDHTWLREKEQDSLLSLYRKLAWYQENFPAHFDL